MSLISFLKEAGEKLLKKPEPAAGATAQIHPDKIDPGQKLRIPKLA